MEAEPEWEDAEMGGSRKWRELEWEDEHGMGRGRNGQEPKSEESGGGGSLSRKAKWEGT